MGDYYSIGDDPGTGCGRQAGGVEEMGKFSSFWTEEKVFARSPPPESAWELAIKDKSIHIRNFKVATLSHETAGPAAFLNLLHRRESSLT